MSNGNQHPWLTRRPIKSSKMPPDPTPVVGNEIVHPEGMRRLIAAYALQAALDYYWPTCQCKPGDLASAMEFMHSPEGQDVIWRLGIPITRLKAALGEEVAP